MLICDDPDAPVMTWVHWVYFDIPPAVTALPEGMPKDEKPAMGASTAGAASAISATAGPCRLGHPPLFLQALRPGHHPEPRPRGEEEEVLKAMEGHILGTAEPWGPTRRTSGSILNLHAQGIVQKAP